MLIKMLVFNCKQRLFHDQGNVFEWRDIASLVAKLSQQNIVRRKYPQRNFGAITRHRTEVRQFSVKHSDGNHEADRNDDKNTG